MLEVRTVVAQSKPKPTPKTDLNDLSKVVHTRLSLNDVAEVQDRAILADRTVSAEIRHMVRERLREDR